MSVLDIHTTILVYGDGEATTTNPKRRFVDWSRHVQGVAVGQPFVREYVAQPGEVLSIFSGARTLQLDGTTALSLSLNPVRAAVYRMKHEGGTAPGFRTRRTLDLTGIALTLTVNNNATMVLQAAGGLPGVLAGDTCFIPGPQTGDGPTLFSPNNAGFWTVIAVAADRVTMRRPVGEEFVGVSETVTPAAASEISFFSAAGVQKGDTLEVTDGFSPVAQKSFVVSEVTDGWVEFLSTENLPLETGILPGAAGLQVYTEAKRFFRIEVDQEAVVRLNGDTGNSNRLSPRVSGDPEQVAHFEKWGPCWQLQVVNRSTTAPMVVNFISVE